MLGLFDIVPDYDLDLMSAGLDLTDVTPRVLQVLRPVLSEFRPSLVLVHGDTTTLATPLAGYYQRIPVGHVEAGLRTRNIYAPWPEEIKGKVAGAITTLHSHRPSASVRTCWPRACRTARSPRPGIP